MVEGKERRFGKHYKEKEGIHRGRKSGRRKAGRTKSPQPPEAKRFGGKEYELEGSFPKYRRAKQVAKKIRKEGGQARVTEFKKHRKKVYTVYSRY